MYRRPCFWAALVLMLVGSGCGVAERAELEKVKAELAAVHAELQAQRAAAQSGKQGTVESLERLAVLQTQGALTKEEFDAAKKALLAPAAQPKESLTPMDDLAKQLRTLQSLYSNGALNNIERDQKKQQLLQKGVKVTNLKKDLETVQTLYSESVINNLDRDALKQQLLK